MELALNLLWLMLALPAIWMWRHESVCTKDCRCFGGIRSFVLFGCVLMLLFPVISATDDLHAMRQEIEESGPSKRVVKQTVSDKSLVRFSNAGGLPALILPVSCGRNDEVCGQVLIALVRLTEQRRLGKPSSRAPPFSFLSMCIGFAA
ncbi:MAG TPA: hypothetical protein VN777_03405 [Terriglobales bacterium]|nr:hypothetical protein [Terriglobales bacterium]